MDFVHDRMEKMLTISEAAIPVCLGTLENSLGVSKLDYCKSYCSSPNSWWLIWNMT